MALVLKKLYHSYFSYFYDQADERSNDYFLASSPIYPTVIVLTYLYVVTDLGPKLMKNRPAFCLKNVISAYNLVQVVANGYLVYHGFTEMLNTNWYCSPVEYTRTERNLLKVYFAHYYFMLKLLDLMDTVFFVLRKRHRQISFLHVYHHTAVILVSWFGLKFWAGGHSIYLAVINSFVHVIMYGYYFIAIYKPEYKNVIWIKKYITILQIAQFGFYIATYAQVGFRPDCKYPKTVSYLCVPQNIFMFILFSDFYLKAYVKTKTPNQTIIKKAEDLPNKFIKVGNAISL